MIPEFERLVKQHPHDMCFTFVEEGGSPQVFTYADLRVRALVLALALQKRGIGRGSFVSLDMSNCPAFVVSIFAAAYGGYTLIALNHRLTAREKAERLADVCLHADIQIALNLDEALVEERGDRARSHPKGKSMQRRRFMGKKADSKPVAEHDAAFLSPSELVHFAERSAALFDSEKAALVLFTSGTSGRPKAASLSWQNLVGAAVASNASLNTRGKGLWQLALPLFHIGGFEIVVRSIFNASPFVMYRRFEAQQVLADVDAFGASHISVVDKMLQDLIRADTSDALKRYEGILLGGAATNPLTLATAVARGSRVFASYGMTETSSQIASELVTEGYDGSLSLLPGYEVQIVAPNEQGVGQLAVRGPGVFLSYLNARAAYTADGFFLTGDSASFQGGKLKVRERLTDMFVSGGENIYPAEIREKLMRIPGVRDACVFGAEDETWGRRPIALLERDASEIKSNDSLQAARKVNEAQCEEDTQLPRRTSSPQAFSLKVEKSLEQRLSKVYRPRHICVLDEFPRTGIGKTDKQQLEKRYDERLEIQEVTLYRIRQKLVTPFMTAKTTMRTRESIMLEVKDWAGRTGVGECVAFETDWYLPETLDADERILTEHLVPLVLQQVYLHPREVSVCFNECIEAEGFPLAKAALEPALWDLYGKIVEKPLWLLMAESLRSQDPKEQRRYEKSVDDQTLVPGGMVLGIMPLSQTLAAVQEATAAGYTRVKLKIKPGDDIERIRAIRKAFPLMTIMLDANQSYTERDIEALKVLDGFDIRCIEEPLDPSRLPRVGPRDFFSRLARLQEHLSTPICLDESIVTPDDLARALAIPKLSCYSLKIGKWGGVQGALDFYQECQARGISLWMGGMYETGISKRMHAAFETLPGIDIPGDLSGTSRYFMTEIAKPAFEVEAGMIPLNPAGYRFGLGCELDYEVLERVTIKRQNFTRNP